MGRLGGGRAKRPRANPRPASVAQLADDTGPVLSKHRIERPAPAIRPRLVIDGRGQPDKYEPDAFIPRRALPLFTKLTLILPLLYPNVISFAPKSIQPWISLSPRSDSSGLRVPTWVARL